MLGEKAAKQRVGMKIYPRKQTKIEKADPFSNEILLPPWALPRGMLRSSQAYIAERILAIQHSPNL